MAYQRVEVLSGTERRRSYTPAEKVRMVDEAFRPGVVVTEAARRLGVHESLLYRWCRLMMAESGVADQTGFVAVTLTPEPVASEPVTEDPPLPSPLPPSLPVPAASLAGVLEIALCRAGRGCGWKGRLIRPWRRPCWERWQRRGGRHDPGAEWRAGLAGHRAHRPAQGVGEPAAISSSSGGAAATS